MCISCVSKLLGQDNFVLAYSQLYSPTLEQTLRVRHYVVLRTLKHLCSRYIHSSFLSLMGIVHCKCDHMDKVLERQSWWHEICHSNTAFMQHCRMRMHQGVLSQRISPAGMWVDDRQCHQQRRLVLPQGTSLNCRNVQCSQQWGRAATKSPLAGCFHCL